MTLATLRLKTFLNLPCSLKTDVDYCRLVRDALQFGRTLRQTFRRNVMSSPSRHNNMTNTLMMEEVRRSETLVR